MNTRRYAPRYSYILTYRIERMMGMIWETTSKALTLKDNDGKIKVDIGVFKRGLFNGKQIWGMLPRDFQTVIGYLRDYANGLKDAYVDAVKAHYRIDKELNQEKVVLAELRDALAVAQQNYDYQLNKVNAMQEAHDAHLRATEAFEQTVIDEIQTMSNNNLGECYFHSGEGLYLYDKNFHYLGKYSVENPNQVNTQVEPPEDWLVDYTLPDEGTIKAEVDNE